MPVDERSGALAEPQVKAMFDRIAGFYDRMNGVMTAGLHRRWRQRAVELAAVGPGDRVLDVATGTGDLAIALAKQVGTTGEVIGCDFSDAMLEQARRKAPELRFEHANALELPYPPDHFTAATVGFGLRNFSDRKRALAELVRVVEPGGRVVVLEITTPQRAPLSTFFRLWFDFLVPRLGRLAGDSGAAYHYLPQSVKQFPPPSQLAQLFSEAGMHSVSWVLTGGGIIAIHVGTVGGALDAHDKRDCVQVGAQDEADILSR